MQRANKRLRQVNREIRVSYSGLARNEGLAGPKYTDTGGVLGIMAMTVMQTHLSVHAA